MKTLDLHSSHITLASLDALEVMGCFILLHSAYRTYIELQLQGIASPHQFVFDNRARTDEVLFKDAISGTVYARIYGMAIPIAILETQGAI